MKLVKSLLLAAPAAILAVGAQAADLPTKKAAPVSYVKVCDAYGAGFFYIPGTDTCLKVGGYVRAQYEYTPRKTVATINPSYKAPGASSLTLTAPAAEDATGWLARGRVDMDARTQSAWGTVRTVLGLRLQVGSGQFQGNANGTAYGATTPAQSVWAEAAYMQFAGFTAGRAGENFAFMPPFTWTGQHFWAGYPVGVKQLAYTATFGGGFSATLALEDKADLSYMNQAGTIYGTAPYAAAAPTYLFPNNAPVFVGNLRVDQAWGSAQIMGTVGQNRAVDNAFGGTSTTPATYTRTGYAIGAGVKFNLPMLAAGDALYLTAAYADGMLDQLEGNSTSSNNPDSTNNLRGLVHADQNLWTNGSAVSSTKGYALGGMLVHYWAPTLRSVVAASYINLHQPGFVSSAAWYAGGMSNVHAYEVSGSLIWAPVTNFDIGVELAYRKLEQSVTGSAADVALFNRTNVLNASVNPNAWNARLRIQRTF